MKKWLAIAAVLPFAAAAGAEAQTSGLAAIEVVRVARVRELDLRLSQELGAALPTPLMRGLIIRHELAPNAAVGIGLANIYAKRRAGMELRPDERPSRSRKPAVTFTLKF